MTEITTHYESPGRRRMKPIEQIHSSPLQNGNAENCTLTKFAAPSIALGPNGIHQESDGGFGPGRRVPPIMTAIENSNGHESGSGSSDCYSPPFSECSTSSETVAGYSCSSLPGTSESPCCPGSDGDVTGFAEINSNHEHHFSPRCSGNGNIVSDPSIDSNSSQISLSSHVTNVPPTFLVGDSLRTRSAASCPRTDETLSRAHDVISRKEDKTSFEENFSNAQGKLLLNTKSIQDSYHTRGWSEPVEIAYASCDFTADTSDAQEPKQFDGSVQADPPRNGHVIFPNSSQSRFSAYSSSSEIDPRSAEAGSIHYEVVRSTTSASRSYAVEPSTSSLNGSHVTRPESMVDYQPSPSFDALRAAVKTLYRLDDFDMTHLADGYFSHVFKVVHKTTREVMVLKMNKPERNSKSSVVREVLLMNKLNQPDPKADKTNILNDDYIIKFKGVCVENAKFHALTEYCNADSLHSLIMNHGASWDLPWELRIQLTLEVSRGMEYLHSRGYIHRDLTAVNILLQGKYPVLKAIVADFGLACEIPKENGPLPPNEGNPYWKAPECLNGDFYNEKSDVFSIGIIACQMISGLDADPDAGFPRTSEFGLGYIRFAELCPDDTPVDFLRVAFSCCSMFPPGRPSCSKIVQDLSAAYQQNATNQRLAIQLRRQSNYNNRKTNGSNLTRSNSHSGFKSSGSSTRYRPERKTHPDASKVESAVAHASSASTGPNTSLQESAFRSDISAGIASASESEPTNGDVERSTNNSDSYNTAQNGSNSSQGRQVVVLAGEMAAADEMYVPETEPYSNPFVRNDKMRKSTSISSAAIASGQYLTLSTQPSLESPVHEENRKTSLGAIRITCQTRPEYGPWKLEAHEENPKSPGVERFSFQLKLVDQSTPKRVAFMIEEPHSNDSDKSREPASSADISDGVPHTEIIAMKDEAKEQEVAPPMDPKQNPMRRSLSLPGSPIPHRAICPTILAQVSDPSIGKPHYPQQDPPQEKDVLAEKFSLSDRTFREQRGPRQHSFDDCSSEQQSKPPPSVRRNTIMPVLMLVPETNEAETSSEEDSRSQNSPQFRSPENLEGNSTDASHHPVAGLSSNTEENFEKDEVSFASTENKDQRSQSSGELITINGIIPTATTTIGINEEQKIFETVSSAHIITLDPDNNSNNGGIIHDVQKDRFRKGILVKDTQDRIETVEPRSLQSKIPHIDSTNSAQTNGLDTEEREKFYCSAPRPKDKCSII